MPTQNINSPEAIRLLKLDEEGKLSFERFAERSVPRYAILSHTWGADGDEVTFADLKEGRGAKKPGYQKIEFCGEQARKDGIEYFWIDTCCIDKQHKAELHHAINSMFRWYRDSTRCYVFLSDVLSLSLGNGEEKAAEQVKSSKRTFGQFPDDLEAPVWSEKSYGQQRYGHRLHQSRWFTRGWTLQELLAPTSVEFFCRGHIRLGDLGTLTQQIRNITGIPMEALRGKPLHEFSMKQRHSWIQTRETTKEEDKVYSLLGIFDVEMPIFYGEGESRAFERLEREINKPYLYMRDLRLTDPYDDKKRIENAKGGLLVGSYYWILQNRIFLEWRKAQDNRLLWIKGDPGKGKTMLLCGIIDELQPSMARCDLIAYFFCQETDPNLNNATAVFRGLLYMLLKQRPSLGTYLQKDYDQAGRNMFEDVNAWEALSRILAKVLQSPSLSSTYLIIDALDECVTDIDKLLAFISKNSTCLNVKWVLSSRHKRDIERNLVSIERKDCLSLELNADSIAAAVQTFIRYKVDKLEEVLKYDSATKSFVFKHLTENARDTFLWVSLVCKHLENVDPWDVNDVLPLPPPGLSALYESMLSRISDLRNSRRYCDLLAVMTALYRPVTVQELAVLAEPLETLRENPKAIRAMIDDCGSFLIEQDNIIYFVHQSAKEFLLEQAFDKIFPSGSEKTHESIYSRSLENLSRTLKKNIYSLSELSTHIMDVKLPDPDCDPLLGLQYSCIYWIDHLCHLNPAQLSPIVQRFFENCYLFWLEALGLRRGVAQGVMKMAKIFQYVQAYGSVLLFSPRGSRIRQLFWEYRTAGFSIHSSMEDDWSSCLKTLDCSNFVQVVAFSPCSTLVASGTNHGVLRVWDVLSGECMMALDCQLPVGLISFSPNSTRMASRSGKGDVKIWDLKNGVQLRTRSFEDNILCMTFDQEANRIGCACRDYSIEIYDLVDNEVLVTLKLDDGICLGAAISPDLSWVACASTKETIQIWDTHNPENSHTIKFATRRRPLHISLDSSKLIASSEAGQIKVWSILKHAEDKIRELECLWTYDKEDFFSMDITTFSQCFTRLALVINDGTVEIRDARSGALVQSLKGHSYDVKTIAFSPDMSLIATGSEDGTVKVWEAGNNLSETAKDYNGEITATAKYHDLARIASVPSAGTITIWDTETRKQMQTMRHSKGPFWQLDFSFTSTLIAGREWKTVIIWNSYSEECLQTVHTAENIGMFEFDQMDSLRIGSNRVYVNGGVEPQAETEVTNREPSSSGLKLDEDNWICQGSKKYLLLPIDDRPLSYRIRGNVIVGGTGSGRIWACIVDFTELSR